MTMKKITLFLAASLFLILLAGCSESIDKKDNQPFYFYYKSGEEIAGWKAMETPSAGSGEGTVEKGDSIAVVKAASDGWGGVQSEEFTLDLSKNPVILVQVNDIDDNYKWGLKFVPSDPEIEGHAWGFYLIEDNNYKWDNYAGVNIAEKLGKAIIDLYGEKIDGVLWIYASGSLEARVNVTSIRMYNEQ